MGEGMHRTLALVTVFSLIFLFSVIVEDQLVVPVEANPIPTPTLIMPEEYINVTLSHIDENLLAQVNGTYPFENMFYDTARMDYPVPPDATKITVKVDGTLLDWTYNNENYSTVIGDWPMINWTLSLIPFQNFTIETYYEHPVPIIDGNYTFLYAMGTGRYLDVYAKETTAYVHIEMGLNYTNLHVYAIGFTNETWTWNPTNYTIITGNTSDIITIEVVSEPFAPLQEDLLVTTIPEFPSLFILPLVITAVLLASIVYRRKKNQV